MNSQETKQIILVTGAARSGKSEWAEKLARQGNKPVTYVATAKRDPNDLEWETRINQHRLRRPAAWQTVEICLDLDIFIREARPPQCLLVDSLGTWVANSLSLEDDDWAARQADLLMSLEKTSVEVILVAEETGWGVIPPYPLGRRFRDRLGRLNQHVGTIANLVYLVAGGHALNLSQLGEKLK